MATRGRPKGSKNKIPNRARPDSADCSTLALTDPDVAAEAGTPKKKRGHPKPGQTPVGVQEKMGSLVSCLLRDPKLSPTDKTAIRTAYRTGLTAADLSALTVYELRRAMLFLESGDLSAKDYIVSLNKAASAVAAAAQLDQSAQGAGASSVTVTFSGTGTTSTRPEAAQATNRDPSVGDIIDTE